MIFLCSRMQHKTTRQWIFFGTTGQRSNWKIVDIPKHASRDNQKTLKDAFQCYEYLASSDQKPYIDDDSGYRAVGRNRFIRCHSIRFGDQRMYFLFKKSFKLSRNYRGYTTFKMKNDRKSKNRKEKLSNLERFWLGSSPRTIFHTRTIAHSYVLYCSSYRGKLVQKYEIRIKRKVISFPEKLEIISRFWADAFWFFWFFSSACTTPSIIMWAHLFDSCGLLSIIKTKFLCLYFPI